jgi:hypothetical protein
MASDRVSFSVFNEKEEEERIHIRTIKIGLLMFSF